MGTSFSSETERALRNAGWRPGRSVDTGGWHRLLETEGFVLHRAACVFLSEFGGLYVNIRGAGLSCAKTPFELDPVLCSGESGRFSAWSLQLDRSFAPIGDLDGGRYFLAMDERSYLYVVTDWVACLGREHGALDSLVLGIAAEEIG